MPDLKITVSATQAQAEQWAQCQALVLFLNAAEVEAFRARFAAIHVLAQQVQAGLEHHLNTGGASDPEKPETLQQVHDMAAEIERYVHELKLTMGTAYFAQPGANGETIH